MIKKRQPALHSWFCLLPGQAEDMSEAQMMPQTVVAATPSDAVKEFVSQSLAEGTLASEDGRTGALFRVRRYNTKNAWIVIRACWGVRTTMVTGPKK